MKNKCIGRNLEVGPDPFYSRPSVWTARLRCGAREDDDYDDDEDDEEGDDHGLWVVLKAPVHSQPTPVWLRPPIRAPVSPPPVVVTVSVPSSPPEDMPSSSTPSS